MNSDQTNKAREMIFGIHVHIIQGSIHAKFYFFQDGVGGHLGF